MTRTRNTGLPEGVHPHAKRFRCRIHDFPSGKVRWAAVFKDPFKCHLYYLAAEKAHAAGQPPPPRDGDDIAEETMTFWSLLTETFRDALLRDATAPTTSEARDVMLKKHLKHSAWVYEPVEDITRAFLERWFDMRLDREVPAPIPGEAYDWAADLAVLPEISRRQAGHLLKVTRRCFAYAVASRLTPLSRDPAEMLVLRRLGKLAQTEVHRNRALKSMTSNVSKENIIAIARFLNWMDLIPLWLCYLCGLRISETFGVRIGDWDPIDRRLWIEVQHGTFVKDDGSLLRHRPWVKSPTSMRYLYVCKSLATALDTYIAAAHGPNPDQSTPICVGYAGPEATQAPQTWRLQFKAAISKQHLTVNVRRNGELLPLAATPHSLRGAISTFLDEAGVSEAARSFYLGHKLPGNVNGSRTTAQFYSKPSDNALANIADVIEQHVVELGIDLLPERSDDYMTVKQAAAKLQVSTAYLYKRIAAGVLTVYGNQPRPDEPPTGNKRARRRVTLLRRADIDAVHAQLKPTPDLALPAAEVAKRLGLKLQRVLLLSRAEKGHELRRWDGPPASLATGDIYIETASVERYRDQQRRIGAGELLPATAALQILGVDHSQFAHIRKTELPSEMHNNHVYYQAEGVDVLARASQPPESVRLSWAAARAFVPISEFLLLAGGELSDLTPADGHRWIPAAVLGRVKAIRDKQRKAARRQADRIASEPCPRSPRTTPGQRVARRRIRRKATGCQPPDRHPAVRDARAPALLAQRGHVRAPHRRRRRTATAHPPRLAYPQSSCRPDRDSTAPHL